MNAQGSGTRGPSLNSSIPQATILASRMRGCGTLKMWHVIDEAERAHLKSRNSHLAKRVPCQLVVEYSLGPSGSPNRVVVYLAQR
jgi:hypothetical protein